MRQDSVPFPAYGKFQLIPKDRSAQTTNAPAGKRALAFAAAKLLLALSAGTVLRVDRIALLGFLVDPGVLDAVFVVNLAVLIYRLVAIVDAYRVARYLNDSAASGAGQAGRARIPGNLASSPACSQSSWS